MARKNLASCASQSSRVWTCMAVCNAHGRVPPFPQTIPAAIALARTLGKVEKIMQPAPEDEVAKAKIRADGCQGSVIFVVYETVRLYCCVRQARVQWGCHVHS